MAETPTILDQHGRPIAERATAANPSDWLREAFGASANNASNEPVNTRTAMTVMTFFACVKNISEDIAKLPKKLRRTVGRRSDEVADHPAARVLRSPNPSMDRHTFWQTIMSHALTEPGGYAAIIRRGNNDVDHLSILDPSRLSVSREDDYTWYYRYSSSKGGTVLLNQEDVFHLHGLGWDGVSGYNLPVLAKQLLGAAIALQKYRGAFFGNGIMPAGVLRHPAELSAEATERLRTQFQTRYSGSANANSIMMLEEGMEWQQVSVDPEKAEMTDLTHVTIEDICRIYRMPPHKVQHLKNATFSNIEHQGLEYDRDTLDPWADRWRAECDFKLLTPAERDAGYHHHIEMNALMRADIKTRQEYYKTMYYMGTMSANDILALEDRNPIDDGDRYFVQQNLVPVDKIDEQMAPTPAPAPEAPPSAEEDDTRLFPAFEMVLESQIAGILRVELDKARRAKLSDEFYVAHFHEVRTRLRDQIVATVRALNPRASVEDTLNEYATMHCAESRRDVEGGDLTTWMNGDRANRAARWILEAIEKCKPSEA